MGKLLMIGLDGATWGLIKPWISEGELPTFQKLISEGVIAQLDSTIPSNTIPAWNSLSTGKNPGKLGLFSWLTKAKGKYEFKPRFLYEKNVDVWDLLSNSGKRVLLANVPNIHVAFRTRGSVVAGFLHFGEEVLTYQKSLKNILDVVTGGYEVDVLDDIIQNYYQNLTAGNPYGDTLSDIHSVKPHEYVKGVERVMNKHSKAFTFLLREKKWDFAFIVFTATDRVQHKAWGDKETILNIYRKLDAYVKEILEIPREEITVFVVSDHGFGPKRRIFNVNEWLMKEGYLKLKKQRVRRTIALSLIKMTALLEKMKMLGPVRHLARSFGLKEKARITADRTFRINPEGIDWASTIAFTSPGDCGQEIYLNLRGREEQGALDPQQYEAVRDEIILKLKNLKDPETGKTVSAKVHKREEIYHGEYIEIAPDLVIEQNDEIQGVSTSVGMGQIFSRASEDVGHHRIDGIFIAWGQNIKKGVDIRKVKIYDVAPTILHIFAIPIPKDMDGRVLMEIFEKPKSPTFESKTSATVKEHAAATYSKREEEKIIKRLRKLGYI